MCDKSQLALVINCCLRLSDVCSNTDVLKQGVYSNRDLPPDTEPCGAHCEQEENERKTASTNTRSTNRSYAQFSMLTLGHCFMGEGNDEYLVFS
jgi:hypothetical protein